MKCYNPIRCNLVSLSPGKDQWGAPPASRALVGNGSASECESAPRWYSCSCCCRSTWLTSYWPSAGIQTLPPALPFAWAWLLPACSLAHGVETVAVTKEGSAVGRVATGTPTTGPSHAHAQTGRASNADVAAESAQTRDVRTTGGVPTSKTGTALTGNSANSVICTCPVGLRAPVDARVCMSGDARGRLRMHMRAAITTAIIASAVSVPTKATTAPLGDVGALKATAVELDAAGENGDDVG